MKKLLLVLILFTSSIVNSQKIYSVNSQFDADIKVYVVDLVYKVDSQFDVGSNDGKWFFVNSQFDAKKKIFFVDSQFDADLKIYFVSSQFDAGWRESSKKHLLY